ncbi:MAG: NUDIX domain-containing protein [Pseudomonadota bacterium]
MSGERDQVIEVVAAGLLDTKGRVLLCQKGSGPFAGLWELPGGKVEPDETHSEALKRELYEELRVRARLEREPFGEVIDRVAGNTIKLIGYRGEVVSGTIELVEHLDCGWFHLQDFNTEKLGPLDQALIRNWH